jgi:plastocyanin
MPRFGGTGAGFRSNVGFYNPNDAGASVTFQIFDGGAALGDQITRSVGGHTGAQINDVFSAAGASAIATENATIVATSATAVFPYAAVIDNHTTDPIFVLGAADPPAQASTPQTRIVHVGRGGTNFVDDVSGNSETTINVGDTVNWVWEGDLQHGSDAGSCTGGGGNPYGGVHPEGYGGGGCTSDNVFHSGTHTTPWSYSYTFTQSGTFKYFCDVHMSAMTGRVVVNPAPTGSSATATAAPREGDDGALRSARSCETVSRQPANPQRRRSEGSRRRPCGGLRRRSPCRRSLTRRSWMKNSADRPGRGRGGCGSAFRRRSRAAAPGSRG